nr:MAG TPA: hypothetical protein [Caudoviricetes sp.]
MSIFAPDTWDMMDVLYHFLYILSNYVNLKYSVLKICCLLCCANFTGCEL